MNNYIKINGKKIELTYQQVREIQQSFGIDGVRPFCILNSNIFVSK